MNLEHPSITRCILTGYPYPVEEPVDVDDPENDEWEDDGDEICDRVYEEERERRAGFT